MVETYVAIELQRQAVIRVVGCIVGVVVTIETDTEDRICKFWWWLSSEPFPGNIVYYKGLKCKYIYTYIDCVYLCISISIVGVGVLILCTNETITQSSNTHTHTHWPLWCHCHMKSWILALEIPGVPESPSPHGRRAASWPRAHGCQKWPNGSHDQMGVTRQIKIAWYSLMGFGGSSEGFLF